MHTWQRSTEDVTHQHLCRKQVCAGFGQVALPPLSARSRARLPQASADRPIDLVSGSGGPIQALISTYGSTESSTRRAGAVGMRLIGGRRGGADACTGEGARTPHRRGAALRAFIACRGGGGRQGERILSMARPLNEAWPHKLLTSGKHLQYGIDFHIEGAQLAHAEFPIR